MSEAIALSARDAAAVQPGMLVRLFRHRGFAIGFGMFALLLVVRWSVRSSCLGIR
jgi:hypothetical protein